MTTFFHRPVMTGEVLRLLEPRAGGTYLDGTLGGGGHSAAILGAAAGVRLIGFDRDPAALRHAVQRLAPFDGRFLCFRANFADAASAADLAPRSVQGILLDLGISSHQIDEPARGFTFRVGAPLDMRMSQDGGPPGGAATLLASASEEELADVFFHFGEIRRARQLARTVVEMRDVAPLERSEHFVSAIEQTFGGHTDNQLKAQAFQALRIAVNGELESLRGALPDLRDLLAGGGVLAVISYHSLEDRIVKDAFREWSRSCICPPRLPECRCRGRALGATLTRKPLRPSQEEVAENPRSRSALLRAWRRD
jgi:16S rRNA (cytosine1402-N4)-methyltransferase